MPEGAPKTGEASGESVPVEGETSLDFLDSLIAEGAATEQTPAEKAAIEEAMKKAQESYGFDDVEQGRRGFN